MKMKVSEVRRILNSLSDEKVKAKGYKKCSRCGGSGNYSYNPLDGTTCFKCNGLGYVKMGGVKK
jgi:DnaJ-class molecular chaperone